LANTALHPQLEQIPGLLPRRALRRRLVLLSKHCSCPEDFHRASRISCDAINECASAPGTGFEGKCSTSPSSRCDWNRTDQFSSRPARRAPIPTAVPQHPQHPHSTPHSTPTSPPQRPHSIPAAHPQHSHQHPQHPHSTPQQSHTTPTAFAQHPHSTHSTPTAPQHHPPSIHLAHPRVCSACA
jgi:hypothetical protein